MCLHSGLYRHLHQPRLPKKRISPFLREDDDVQERHVRQPPGSEWVARNVRDSDATDVLHVPNLEGDNRLEGHLVRFVVNPPVGRREAILETERRQHSGRIHNLGGDLLIGRLAVLSSWLRLPKSYLRT